MNESAQLVAKHGSGLEGCPLTVANLPSPDTKRWVIRRKAEIVAAVRGGLLSLEDACNRYGLNAEEFQCWQNVMDQFGLAGLRVTRIQFYARHDRSKDSLGRQPTRKSRFIEANQVERYV
jgi:hypothetical protein